MPPRRDEDVGRPGDRFWRGGAGLAPALRPELRGRCRRLLREAPERDPEPDGCLRGSRGSGMKSEFYGAAGAGPVSSVARYTSR